MNRFFHFIVIIFIFLSCTNNKPLSPLFELYSPKQTNINFSNTLIDTVGYNILDYLYYYNGGGVAIGDINNDGLQDVFFVSSQQSNKLYLNKGDLVFQDITSDAGVWGNSNWNTGVAMADINGDGFLDIYVCAVVGVNGFLGHNELYINNGDNTFTEESKKYNLDIMNYSTSSTFFDYDLDGDLDMFLLNHAVHSEESFGKSNIRLKRNDESGDKLFRNDNGIFNDISIEAGIYGGANGFGLGVAVFDFNNDGFPDIYVGNDFHEDDYFYINNGDGSFIESAKTYFAHMSKFSMGNDAADLNNDGFVDIITMDMLPDDEKVLKSSVGNENIEIQNLRVKNFGYHYQYSRNMLQINQNAKCFVETALMSNVSNTDWSWSVLIADYNNDKIQDLFISNGIPKRPNDLDYIKYVSSNQVRKKLQNTNLIDAEALSYMPDGNLLNRFYMGTNDLIFKNVTQGWVNQHKSYSSGSAYGDLDNDGDLDLVTNNINEPAFVYINTLKNKNFLKIQFKYINQNRFGIGTKAILYHNGELQQKELFTQRGFQSSVQPIIHFGLDTIKMIDSIKIIWPNTQILRLNNVKANQDLIIDYSSSTGYTDHLENFEKTSIFNKIDNNLGINYKNIDNNYIDFLRHQLMPYQISDRGPALSIGDLNHDGMDDVFIGNGKHAKSSIFLQNDNEFVELKDSLINSQNVREITSSIIYDFDDDDANELLVASGGGEFYENSPNLQNDLFLLSNKTFKHVSHIGGKEDTSVLQLIDCNRDGILDVFVGNCSVPNDFGKIPESYFLMNIKGKFNKVSLGNLGMIRDAIPTDFNNDGYIDLIVIGEWMAPIFLENTNKGFKNKSSSYVPSSLNGLWRSIIAYDIDNDGDQDYLLGNWGLNSKFNASVDNPLLMYYSDFDKNSKAETVLAIYKNNNYYPIDFLDDLGGQLEYLTRKKFTKYKDFAGKTFEQIFEKDILDNAKVFSVHTLASGMLINQENKYIFKPFQNELQVAPINSFTKIKFNKKEAVVVGGNYFGVKPYHGRFAGFSGALILSDQHIKMGHEIGLDFFNREVTQLNVLNFHDKQYLVAIIHNQSIQIYEVL